MPMDVDPKSSRRPIGVPRGAAQATNMSQKALSRSMQAFDSLEKRKRFQRRKPKRRKARAQDPYWSLSSWRCAPSMSVHSKYDQLNNWEQRFDFKERCAASFGPKSDELNQQTSGKKEQRDAKNYDR